MAEMKKWKTGCKAHNRLYHNAYIGPVRVCVPVRSTPGVLKTEVKMCTESGNSQLHIKSRNSTKVL